MIRMKRLPRLLLCISMAGLATCLLGACSSDSDSEQVTATPPPPKPTAAAAPADDVSAMAKAVGDGKPGAAVTIRYDFSGKPAAGLPTDLEIAFIPNAGVDSLEATLTGMEGITLAGPVTASFNEVESGKPYRHKVSVLPDRTGVFYITVSINTQIAGSSLARTFSIPFVVGQPVKQQKPEPARDAKGEAIQSMPAQETKTETKQETKQETKK
jgi:hypothetical protein